MVEGSRWVLIDGAYLLVSCPLGYEMFATIQMCEQCSAGYFCIGGSAARAACPAGTYSLPESNSSLSCKSAVFIMVSIILGITQVSFTLEMQNQYRNALANLCGTSDYQVGIQSLSKAEWSVYGSDSIEVVFKIAVFDMSNADLVVSRLEKVALQNILKEANLPDASLNFFKVDSPLQNTDPANWILAIAGTGTALGILVIVTVWLINHQVKSPAELELQTMVTEMRKKLRITLKDGYAVGSEGYSLLQRRQLIFLSRAQVEAAGNLALMQEFDVNQFDMFCLSIRHSGSCESSMERNELLRKWLLECSHLLLRPDFPDQDSNIESSFHGFKMILTQSPSKRFQYFERRLIKARIWLEDRELFSNLKIISQGFMDELSILCQLRYEALCHEPMGKELAMLHLPRLSSIRYFCIEVCYCTSSSFFLFFFLQDLCIFLSILYFQMMTEWYVLLKG
jgi:hypothetical protein